MTIIRITEFKGYSTGDFFQFLRIHSKSLYGVVIPKEHSLEEHGPVFLMDYYNAVYAGQLLSRLSDDIAVVHPAPFEKGEFGFIVMTRRLKQLARLLHYFCSAYDWENHYDTCVQFQVVAADMYGILREDEQFACPFYVEFINEYLQENNE
jgi:hypothetical protein